MNLEVACQKFKIKITKPRKKNRTYMKTLFLLNLNNKNEKKTGPIISDKAPKFFGNIIHVGITLLPFDICFKQEFIESYKLKFVGNDDVKKFIKTTS